VVDWCYDFFFFCLTLIRLGRLSEASCAGRLVMWSWLYSRPLTAFFAIRAERRIGVRLIESGCYPSSATWVKNTVGFEVDYHRQHTLASVTVLNRRRHARQPVWKGPALVAWFPGTAWA